MENKIKHLEFIQNVITRMNANSFLIKGWTITLISALFALAAKDSNINYALISYIIIPVFWVLDGFYISTERMYRDLYSEVAVKREEEIDFNMNASSFKTKKGRSWIEGIFSQTLIPFYGTALITTILILLYFKK